MLALLDDVAMRIEAIIELPAGLLERGILVRDFGYLYGAIMDYPDVLLIVQCYLGALFEQVLYIVRLVGLAQKIRTALSSADEYEVRPL